MWTQGRDRGTEDEKAPIDHCLAPAVLGAKLSCVCGRCSQTCTLDEQCSALPLNPLCALGSEVFDECAALGASDNLCAPESALMVSGDDTSTE
jgi:hypothetical protein